MTAPHQSQSHGPATAAAGGSIDLAHLIRANEVPPALSRGNISLPCFDLAIGDVHVWWVDLLAQLGGTDQLEDTLSPDELDRGHRFHFAVDRRRFVMRRAARRHLIGRYLNLEPPAIRFSTGNCGKPGIAGQEEHGGLRFSCSHSGELALIAVTRHQKIGVDLEQHRPLPDALALARSFFSPGEFAELQQIPPALQTKAFFDGWTRKEAFVKALGLGLSFPLHRFSVSLAPDQPARLLEVETDSSAVNRWSMQSLHLASDYSATLVVAGKIIPPTCFEFQFPSLAATAI